MKARLPLKAKAPNRQSRQLLLFMMRMTPGQNTSPIILSIFSAFQVSVTYSNSLLHELVQQKCKSRLSQTTDSPAKRKNHDSDESGRAIVIASEEAKTIRHGSHLRQNLDKFVLITKNLSNSCHQLTTPSATYLSRRRQKLVYGDKSSKVPSSCLGARLFANNKQKLFFLQ